MDIVNKEHSNIKKVRICTEWDMAWFCDSCGKMLSWKT